MSELVRVEQAGPVIRLTLCRPEVHNALNDALIDQLCLAFEHAASNQAVRVIVLGGEGRSFCAGADLGWMKAMVHASLEANQQDARRLVRLLAAMVELPVPIIARVHGAALGGGMGLVACCDLVVAAPRAQFALTEVRLGLAPAMIFPYLLRKVQRGQLLAYALTGERFAAQEALAFGLVNEVAEDVDTVVERWIADLGQCGPQALAAVKSHFDRTLGLDRRAAEELGAELIARLRVGGEGQEGMRAFLEHRQPTWRLGSRDRVG